MLVDTHAHLQDRVYARDIAEVLARATAAGVERIVNVSYDQSSSEQAVQLAREHHGIFAAVGTHPHDAASWSADSAVRLRQLAGEKKVVAIGEIGLDYHRNLSPKPAQQKAFIAQIELARELSLPIIVHSREATEDILAVLGNYRDLRGVIHCYSGTRTQAKKFLDLGYYLGITGIVTFPQAGELQAVAASVPLDRLLVETDAPYLAPQSFRGQRNEPAYVVEVAVQIAALKKIGLADVAKQTTLNAVELFHCGE